MTWRNTARQSLNRMYGIPEEDAKPAFHDDLSLRRGSSCNSLHLSTTLSVVSNASNRNECSSSQGSVKSEPPLSVRQTSGLFEEPNQSRLSLDSKLASSAQPSSSSKTRHVKATYHCEDQYPTSVQRSHDNEQYPGHNSPRVYLCSSEDLPSKSDSDSEGDSDKVPVPPTLRKVGGAASPNAFIQQQHAHKCPTCGCSNWCGLQKRQNGFHYVDVSGEAQNSSQISRWWYFGSPFNNNDSSFDNSQTHLWYYGPGPTYLSQDIVQERKGSESKTSRRRSKRTMEVEQEFV